MEPESVLCSYQEKPPDLLSSPYSRSLFLFAPLAVYGSLSLSLSV